MCEIMELLNSRERYGGDKSAINRHSIRVYMYNGKTYVLDRTTDCNPRFYELYERTDGIFSKTIKIFGKRYWGDGISWKHAIKIARYTILKMDEQNNEKIEKRI